MGSGEKRTGTKPLGCLSSIVSVGLGLLLGGLAGIALGIVVGIGIALAFGVL